MRIGWSTGSDERALLTGEFAGVERALARRGLSVEPVTGPDTDVQAVILAAPARQYGPDGVRAWRRWAEAGRSLLVLGLPGAPPTADIAFVVPGLELLDDGTIGLRGRAKLEYPTAISPGILAPQGAGWFRFGRALDVLDVRSDDVGHRWMLIGLGDGRIGLLADAAEIGDEALKQDVRRLSQLLASWLGPLHGHVCARALSGRPLDLPDPSASGLETAEKLRGGVRIGEWLRPGGHGHAVRALAESELVGVERGRLSLTDAGREHVPLVATLLELSDVLLAADERGRLRP